MQINDIYFAEKIYLYLIFLLPFFLYILLMVKKRHKTKIDFLNDIKTTCKTTNIYFYIKLFLIFLILFLYIIILADPQKTNIKEKINKNWIDIVIAFDVSKSMDANDLSPSRIEKAKEVLIDFIEKQKTNRLWLVIYAWKPLSWIPLTFDYDILLEILENTSTQSLNQNISWFEWTAIWDAILLSKGLFKEQDREKVIILITDWDANKWVDPVLVSRILKEEGIKVFSIWIGSDKWWMIGWWNPFFPQRLIVPPLKTQELKKISKITDWYFFRAWDDESLENIFKKLEELEKNDIEVSINKMFTKYYKYFIYLLIILIFTLFLLETRKVKN